MYFEVIMIPQQIQVQIRVQVLSRINYNHMIDLREVLLLVQLSYGHSSKGDIPPAVLVEPGYRSKPATGGARTCPRLPQIQF